MHDPGRGRRIDQSLEGVDASHGCKAPRRDFLLHHLRMDDVELADKRTGRGLYDGNPFYPDEGALKNPEVEVLKYYAGIEELQTD
jgi:hypothetical protein